MKEENQRFTYLFWLFTLLTFTLNVKHVHAQEKESHYKEIKINTWFNSYGNIRISNHLFWIAQTHFRFQENNNTSSGWQWAQVYNRHALSYLFSKKFNASLGGVLRVNFNQKQIEPDALTVPEWRIWHQYLFAMPLYRSMIYHRIRVEHRWSKGFEPNAAFIFRNRWRYMFKIKTPIGKPKLGSNTFYISPEAELIMQSGKAVIDSPMEDLRLHTSIGYIVNPRLTYAAGLMYSQGQDLADGAFYKQKLVFRFHAYFSLDTRKIKNKLPSIHMTD